MVVLMRKVMEMQRSLYVCFSAANWYFYKVVTIANKFTWSWACYKIRLSADNFKKPTQTRWVETCDGETSCDPSQRNPVLIAVKWQRHGRAILVFRLLANYELFALWWERIGRSVTSLSNMSRMDWQPTFLSYKASLTRGAPLSVTYYTVLP